MTTEAHPGKRKALGERGSVRYEATGEKRFEDDGWYYEAVPFYRYPDGVEGELPKVWLFGGGYATPDVAAA